MTWFCMPGRLPPGNSNHSDQAVIRQDLIGYNQRSISVNPIGSLRASDGLRIAAQGMVDSVGGIRYGLSIQRSYLDVCQFGLCGRQPDHGKRHQGFSREWRWLMTCSNVEPVCCSFSCRSTSSGLKTSSARW
jgi:hypothetical protein